MAEVSKEPKEEAKIKVGLLLRANDDRKGSTNVLQG